MTEMRWPAPRNPQPRAADRAMREILAADRAKHRAAPGCPTPAEIEAAKTPKGGWTKAQLQQWGVPWPPPKGWKHALSRGEFPAT